ncbi:AfsR/SARP family transcriptional regulator [Ktedonosporobacter rubrisoli]|nr:BTAD domain-containing putative transcriptional regulator [Ktedonosporobacter rubrisoli]
MDSREHIHSTCSTTQASLHPYEREQQAVFRVYLFGSFRVFQNNTSLEDPIWRRTRIQSLLKWFILNPEKPFSADYLADLFWPQASTLAAHRNLRVNIHYLRHLLEPGIARGQESSFIRRLTNNFYLFHRDDTWWVDVWELQRQFEMAQQIDLSGNRKKAAFFYSKITDYFERGFLPEDVYEDYVQPYRDRYERHHLQILRCLIEIHLQNNELDEALEYAYRTLSIDPYNQIAVNTIIDIYCKQGNHVGAMRVFNKFRDSVQAELGLEISRCSCTHIGQL